MGPKARRGPAPGRHRALPSAGHSSRSYCHSWGLRPGLWADGTRPGAEKLPGPTEGRARQDAGGGTAGVTAEVTDGDGGGGGDAGQRPGCSSPAETSSPSLRPGTEPRSRRPPSPSPCPAPLRSLTAASASRAPSPLLRAAPPARPARLRLPPRGAPRPRAPHVAAGTSTRITWRRRPALTHQSAPAERLRSSAPPNQRPRGALAPPPPALAPAPRRSSLKGLRGRLCPPRASLLRLGTLSAQGLAGGPLFEETSPFCPLASSSFFKRRLRQLLLREAFPDHQGLP